MATGGTDTHLKLSGETITSIAPLSDGQADESASTKGDVYRSRVWKDLRSLSQQDQLTDVMLATEGRSIPCHKVLLAAASKFFYDKFITNPEFLEQNILDIDDIDFDTLTSVVSYIYSGNIELTVEKTEKLIPASVSLMLPELTGECRSFLAERNSDTLDCVTVYKIAKATSLKNAAQKAWDVMLDNFQDIITTNAFKEFSDTELKEYIGDKDLNVANEDPVFEAVVTWVRHDMDNRKDRFETLLEHVTLSHCSTAFLRDVVLQEPLIRDANGWQRVAEALATQAASGSLQLGAPRALPQSDNSLVAIYTTGEGNVQCWVLKGGESEWLKKAPFVNIYGGNDRSVCMARDGILITGYTQYSENKNKKPSLPTMDCIDVTYFNVEERLCHASVCVGGQVYVLGGCIGLANDFNRRDKSVQSVEYLDAKTGSWCLTTDMPIALHDHSAVNYKHYIYVFGGMADSQISRASFVFDTVTKKWSRGAKMPQYCVYASSVVLRDRIYVLGGDNDCFLSYNPGQDEWEPISKPKVVKLSRSAVVWGDRILLCGRYQDTAIEEYNAHTDTWVEWKHSLPDEGCRAMFAVKL